MKTSEQKLRQKNPIKQLCGMIVSQYLEIFFSLTLTKTGNRLMASTGGFNRAKMRDPKRMLNQNQKNKWSDVIGNLSETHMQIFDGAGQTIAEMRAKTRKMISQFPYKKPILFIDYLTLRLRCRFVLIS